MQNRYVGDVGDFAKYGMLRVLGQYPPFRLAVLWFLYNDEYHNRDGGHISYLDRAEFRKLDPSLHDQLRFIVLSGRRSVGEVERRGVLPPGTVFVSNLVPHAGKQHESAYGSQRSQWLVDALEATEKADLVFFDPDNGLETASVPWTAQRARKYVFWRELRSFWEHGKSLIVYHHLNRRAPIMVQTDALRGRFVEQFRDASLVKPLLFRRGSCRHFWVVGQPAHASVLASRIDAMLGSGWDQHFEIG
jgi:hypothetical protein